MPHADEFEMLDGIAVLRVHGLYSFDAGVAHVEERIALALAQGYDSLLVDCLGISGFAPPSIAARHAMVRRWATAARGRVCMAVVIGGRFVDPEKYGVRAAANFGLTIDAFETIPDASAWLLAQRSWRREQ